MQGWCCSSFFLILFGWLIWAPLIMLHYDTQSLLEPPRRPSRPAGEPPPPPPEGPSDDDQETPSARQ